MSERAGAGGGTPPEPSRTWEAPVLTAALALGLMLMAIQLWILTVALDLYLGGRPESLWRLAGASGAVFAGGMLVLKVLRAPPRPGSGGPRTPAP